MEIVAGFFVACLVLLGMSIVALKIIAVWHRFVNDSRGEPVVQPSEGSNLNRPGVVYYRTSNGRSDYKFRIQRMASGGYRVYVLDHPSYGSQDTSDLVTHLLRDGQGPFICFTGRIATMEQARNLAAIWADKTEDYILDGQRF